MTGEGAEHASIVAGNFDHPMLRGNAEAFRCGFGKFPAVCDPPVGKRGEVRVVTEYVLWRFHCGKLRQMAFRADAHMQGEKGFIPCIVNRCKERVRQWRLAQITKAFRQRRSAKPAVVFRHVSPRRRRSCSVVNMAAHPIAARVIK